MTTLIKIIDFKGEAALIFTREMLERLDVKEGDQVSLISIPDGFELRKIL